MKLHHVFSCYNELLDAMLIKKMPIIIWYSDKQIRFRKLIEVYALKKTYERIYFTLLDIFRQKYICNIYILKFITF